MIFQQRSQLSTGQDEMARIDRRIAELQDRLTRKRMMNQQLANQINAATTAKQAQLRAIQAGLSNKNKTKPVSTVEPFQRSLAPQQVDNHHVSAEDLKPGLSLQEESTSGNKNIDSKYQTLPYNTKFGHLNKAAKIEQLKQEKENNNIGFSEALPRPPPPVYGSRGQDFQGNFGQGIGVVAPLPPSDISTTSASASNKPVSSVAPVYASRPGYTTPTSSSTENSPFSPNSKLSSTPISLTPSGNRDQESPTKLRPALPPKPQNPNPVHGEDGTSVDDEDLPPPPPTTTEPPNDSPTPEATTDLLNGNRGDLSVDVSQPQHLDNSGLMVSGPTSEQSPVPNVHMSMNRRIEM